MENGGKPDESLAPQSNDLQTPLSEKLKQYFTKAKDIRSLDDFKKLNMEQFGTPTLAGDRVASGAIFGYASGYCVKKATKAVAFGVGLGFIGLQALHYNGVIQMNWDKIGKEVERKLDLNEDGVVDEKDLFDAKNRLMKMLGYGMPGAGGFGTGFLLGIRSG
eukprot:GHVU01116188.1.p1 GENE.GHVU01116188.1~~GHVU01116188.1.p1  ORF type:complete len:162 (-),score=23.27 GHVU01116188.1:687-1172(-)